MLLGTFAGTIQLLSRAGVEFEHLIRPQVPIRGVRFVNDSEVLYYTTEECVSLLLLLLLLSSILTESTYTIYCLNRFFTFLGKTQIRSAIM